MITIRPVAHTKKEIEKYVQFGNDLYKGNAYFVPPLFVDDVNVLTPTENPAFEFCESKMWMAYDNEKPVGRITAIINHRANEKFNEKAVRFGFVDFIDDAEVVDKLFAEAENWGREKGMTRIVGPMGFCDMDHEGMLTDGYNEMGTMATIYNYPYYPLHMERMGYKKEVDYVEFRMEVPEQVPEKYARIAKIVQQRLELKVLKFRSRSQLREEYGQAIFNLINETYASAGIYGYVPLTPKQINYYIDMYLRVLKLENICLIADKDDNLICVGISMPSMSNALRKSGGKILPFGWWYLLGGLMGKTDTVDLLLVAVKPEYQSKGVNALLFANLIPYFNEAGFKYAESNVELEENENVQKQWEYFTRRQHRRRRVYEKEIPLA